MPDSANIEAERAMQPGFSKSAAMALLFLPAAILVIDQLMLRLPEQAPIGARTAQVAYEPLRMRLADDSPLRLAGAWLVSVDDQRFSGVSSVALDGDQLLALTDGGAVARLPKPGEGSTALVDELPAGPGDGGFKRNRDSEALTRDPRGRGWWVAFEGWNQLWLYDVRFQRPLERISFGRRRWPRNAGIEGLAVRGETMLAFPEAGRSAIAIGETASRTYFVEGLRGRISEAAVLPDDRMLVVERKFGLTGFRNTLVELRTDGTALVAARRIPLPLGPLDNAEALAVEERAGKPLRLWLMTDDNGQKPLRTLLLALDLAPR